MNQNNRDTTDDLHGDVQSPNSMQIMGEQSLAVDLAGVEIDRQIATAHKFPRVLDAVIKKIGTMACYNQSAAENCIYSLPRGGKPIIGPSIGFANILAQSWGNCIDGGRPVYADRKEKAVVAEGVFHDLESNRKTVMHVSRRIVDSKGRLYSDDMIMVTGMAAASIARRNAILHAVPRALWFPVYEDALQIVRGTVETFAERKDKAFKAFHQFGLKPEQVLAFLGLKGDADMTLEHIPTLQGAYAALRDGTLTVEEILDPRRQAAGSFEKVENPLGDESHDQKTGEVQTATTTAAQSKPAETTEQPAQTDQDRGPGPRQDGEGEGDEPGGDEAPAGGQTQPQGGQAAAGPQPGAQEPQQPTEAAKGKRKTAKDKSPPATEAKAPEPKPAETTKPAEPATPAGGAGNNTAAASSTPAVQPPNTPEQYRDYAKAWMTASTSLSGLDDRWRSERNLRTSCRVVEDIFEEVAAMKTRRAAELKAAG